MSLAGWRWPSARNLAARVLYKGARVAFDLRDGGALRRAHEAAQQALWNVGQRLQHEALRVDEKAPCPFCGRETALVELVRLGGTYCFACSVWGHDPRGWPEEAEADRRDA